jgi:GxxExxY protein
MKLVHEDLTGKIIGAAIDVHRKMGPGFIESIYEKALVIELKKRDLKVAQQLDVPILYEGIEVGCHRIDLYVEDEIVIEMKAIKNIEEIHFAIAKSYLKAVNKKHGLILNFSKPTLEIKRVICE